MAVSSESDDYVSLALVRGPPEDQPGVLRPGLECVLQRRQHRGLAAQLWRPIGQTVMGMAIKVRLNSFNDILLLYLLISDRALIPPVGTDNEPLLPLPSRLLQIGISTSRCFQ